MSHHQNNSFLSSCLTAAIVSLVLLGNPLAIAQPVSPPAISPARESVAERDTRMEWWREARFGMFVHWGLYSGLAGTWEGEPIGKGNMEWLQTRVHADTDVYAERALPLFKPTDDFATQWAKLAKAAGCKYLVFTSKHCEGFALHDSKVSDFDAGTVLNRDLVREIVDACRKEGLRVGFYHAVIDWHHDQYAYANSEQLPHPFRGKPYPNGQRDHAKYQDYLHAQAAELMSNYGQVDIVWWDYSSEDFQGDEAWRSTDLMAMVREKQPAIIMNSRLFRCVEAGWQNMEMTGISDQLDPKYGDFLTPEQHIPASGIPGIDWEACMTMNGTWGFGQDDHDWKTEETLIRNLIDIASKGGNYLLNIGPKGDGTVPEPSVKRLKAIGEWMAINGESIYGTTASPIGKPSWGRCTKKEGKLYLHIFDWPTSGELRVLSLDKRVKQAYMLGDEAKESLEIEREGEALLIHLLKESPDAIASVVVLEME